MKTFNDGAEELAARTGLTAEQIRKMPCVYQCSKCKQTHSSLKFAIGCCPTDYADEIKKLQERISLLESIILKRVVDEQA